MGLRIHQIRHFPLSDKTWCRVRCVECETIGRKEAIKLEEKSGKKNEKARGTTFWRNKFREEWRLSRFCLENYRAKGLGKTSEYGWLGRIQEVLDELF